MVDFATQLPTEERKHVMGDWPKRGALCGADGPESERYYTVTFVERARAKPSGACAECWRSVNALSPVR